MKTFKLIAMDVVEEAGKSVEIPLEDGLIINKENEKATWLLEAYTELSLYDYFKNIQEQSRELIVEVVITKPDNDPAYFQTKVVVLNKFEKNISVLMEGRLRRNKSDYSELLLDTLLEKGLDGPALLSEFKEKMKSKPKLKMKNPK
ncbi:YwpF-like family protein [Neobacillus sp. FSL H8-0543]|uniref:YwpF-like family protein n=1 Tax=Neobacillus sp. FSL H8-0543 TaxID=2954672 RepID=UPI0031581CEA